MLDDMKIRTRVLATHGTLAICLGLVFLYLHATMNNLLFEAFSVAIAIMLSAAALLFAALIDWFAAFREGPRDVHRVVFYLLGGLALALTGFFIGYYPEVSVQLLVLFAAIHALAFGVAAFTFAARLKGRYPGLRALYLCGAISLLFSGTMAALARDLTNPAAILMLALYLCFEGVKMVLFSWYLHHATSATQGQSSCALRGGMAAPSASAPIKH